MATSSRPCLVLLLLAAGGAHAREASSGAECASLGQKPPIADARSAVAQSPGELRSQFKLADAWSEAGCFNDALQVLSDAARQHPGNRELETRLRVARSVVGEEHFFDNLDRAEDQARVKRNAFRCSSLQDVDACNEVARASPNDAQAQTTLGDALLKAGRGADAQEAYRRAAALAPGQQVDEKLASAKAQTSNPTGREAPTRVPDASASTRPRPAATRVARSEPSPARYTNLEPDARSH